MFCSVSAPRGGQLGGETYARESAPGGLQVATTPPAAEDDMVEDTCAAEQGLPQDDADEDDGTATAGVLVLQWARRHSMRQARSKHVAQRTLICLLRIGHGLGGTG